MQLLQLKSIAKLKKNEGEKGINLCIETLGFLGC